MKRKLKETLKLKRNAKFLLLLTFQKRNSETIESETIITSTSIKILSMRKTSTSKSFDEFMKNIRSSRKTIIVYFVKSMITKLMNALISNLYRMKTRLSTQKIN